MDRESFIDAVTQVQGISDSRADEAWEYVSDELKSDGGGSDSGSDENLESVLSIVTDSALSRSYRLAYAEEALADAVGADG